ncbi:hypothetical protein OUZ56_007643 [Daphnia magna]|uniref:Uncharacterized protein n=1 Tax=Daphnia magna TaxID=35525 RepID=A0ABR0AAL5_9CRUS|nr:hypothetical protein OUZ56_007643 [Daphnia magna]
MDRHERHITRVVLFIGEMNWMEAGCDDGDSNAHQRQATATMSSKKNIFICPLVPTALFSVCFNIANLDLLLSYFLFHNPLWVGSFGNV